MISLVRDRADLFVLASVKDEPGPRAPAPVEPDLIAACRRGDRGALDEVFRAYAADLERFLARMAGPRADLEDLLQDTFAAAIRAFPRFRGEASVKTWLHGIAVHIALDHLRRKRRATVPFDENLAMSPEPGPAEDADRKRRALQLYAHLDKLDATKRIALVLYVVEERSVTEVAALMGASVSATKSRLFWARRALLKRLRNDPALAGEGSR